MNESYLTGLRDASVTISGTWTDDDGPLPQLLSGALGQWRDVEHITEMRRLFGVEWWAEKRKYTAVVTGWDHQTCAMNFSVTSPITVERSEWWRRSVFAVVRLLPWRAA